MTDTLKIARRIVEQSDPDNLDSFAYFGDTPLGTTHAFTFSVHRDSETLDRSNFTVISTDLMKRFPRQVHIERMSHFAVGWIEHLVVQMLTKRGTVTKAGEAVIEWKDQLEWGYPVADDEHYSQLQYNEFNEYLTSELPYIYSRELPDCDLDDDVIVERAHEYFSRIDFDFFETPSYDTLLEAIEYAADPHYYPPAHVQIANGQTALPF